MWGRGLGGRGRGGFGAQNNAGRGLGGPGRGGGFGAQNNAGRGLGGLDGANGRGGMRGGNKAVIIPHRHEGDFIAMNKDDDLLAKSMVPGDSVYNEKRISVQNEDGTKVEYRVWNPFRSKLGAAIREGVDNIWIAPDAQVLYLGAASGTSVSHVSDIVGPARILALKAAYFLKTGGHCVLSIKANCIDSTMPADKVYDREVEKLKADLLKPAEMVTLEGDHACVVGSYRVPKKQKIAA